MVGLILLAHVTNAGQVCTTTVPPGSIFNTTWTASNSPYCVTGELSVSLLTIEPGVTVLVDGPYAIRILTVINVAGTAVQPVLFAAKNPAASLWKGLIFQDTPPGSTLAHFTLRDSDDSGIELINASSITLDDCNLVDNFTAQRGGAIDANGVNGDLNINRCTFSGNQSAEHGGAMRVIMNAGSLNILSSVFEGNIANPARASDNWVGGAIYLQSGVDATISNTQFIGNRSNARCSSSFDCSVTARGGAIYVGGDASGTVSIDNTFFMDNRADALNQGNCFFGGTSATYGAGVYVAAGTVSVNNVIMSCNRNTRTNCGPVERGGGIYVDGGTVTVIDSTIARNNDATGVHLVAGSLDVDSSILFFNDANGVQLAGAVNIGYSTIQNWDGGGDGNVSFNPAFAGLGCDPIDFQLLGFPPIDSGNPASADACFRPSQLTEAHDMGAYGGPGACDGDWDFDGVRDEVDNCRFRPNADQRDTDGDSIGNTCDPDVDNDCTVNFADLNVYKSNFFASGDLDTDNDGDGLTNFADLNIVKSFFFGPPGPSGIVPNDCENQ